MNGEHFEGNIAIFLDLALTPLPSVLTISNSCFTHCLEGFTPSWLL